MPTAIENVRRSPESKRRVKSVIKEQPRRKQVSLRCMIYRKGDQFRGECVDLNLIVFGRTMEEAHESLLDAMVGYLEVVLSGDTEGLLPRPSPWQRRALYRWLALRAAIIPKISDYALCNQDDVSLLGSIAHVAPGHC